MIIAITGQKGGVGKSTLAVCLAIEFQERGQRVLLVDADPQGSVRTWSEVAAEAGQSTPTVMAMGATMHRPGQLDQLAAGYDVVLIDSPPRHGDIQRSALLASHVAILPSGPAAVDAWALASSLEVIDEAKVVRPDLRACIVITRKQGRTTLGRAAREVFATSGLPVLETELGYRIAFQECMAAGQGVTTYAPRDAAALELRSLVDNLIAFATGEHHDDVEAHRQLA